MAGVARLRPARRPRDCTAAAVERKRRGQVDIKIGNLAPYSGPASAYSAFAKTEAAYMRMLNDRGGINGRKIQFISYDNTYSPAKAVEQARKLVEQDEVLAIFQAVGTPSNAAIMKYMNIKKVPQLLAATGASKFGDPKNFPGRSDSRPRSTGSRARSTPNTFWRISRKVAVLFPNDDYGRDIYGGSRARWRQGQDHDRRGSLLRQFRADHRFADRQAEGIRRRHLRQLLDPRFGALAIRKVPELGVKPVHFINTTAASISTVLKPAGIEKSTGLITATSIKEPTDPKYVDDPGVQEYLAFMKQYNPDGETANGQNAYGFLASQVLHKVLEQCGDDLSRENIMKQAANLKDLKFGLLFDGILVNTSPTNYFPITQMQMLRFNGTSFDKIGPVMSETVMVPND